jgi:START domain
MIKYYGIFIVNLETPHASGHFSDQRILVAFYKGGVNTMKTLCICLLFIPGMIAKSDMNEWTLKKEKDGITIFSRHSDFSKFNDLRIEMDLPGNVSQLSGILMDVERYTDWVYATRSSILMKRISENEVIYHSEIGAPWPASNRDFYADVKSTLNLANQTLIVASNGMKNYQPEKKDFVRVPMSKGLWTVRTESGNRIHLQYILQMDPGGSLPGWILNTFATKAPIETFSNLKRKMEEMNK